jgi:hypothetical protein
VSLDLSDLAEDPAAALAEHFRPEQLAVVAALMAARQAVVDADPAGVMAEPASHVLIASRRRSLLDEDGRRALLFGVHVERRADRGDVIFELVRDLAEAGPERRRRCVGHDCGLARRARDHRGETSCAV